MDDIGSFEYFSIDTLAFGNQHASPVPLPQLWNIDNVLPGE